MRLRPVFFSQIDDCVRHYPEARHALQAISRYYPVFFTCSGTATGYLDRLRELYPKATFIPCTHNEDNEKAQLLYDILRHNKDWDVLIRTCCDSVITDVRMLLDILDDKLTGKHAVIGNGIFRPDGTLEYIRGGCNASTWSVIDRIRMPTGPRAPLFDHAFSQAARDTGAELIPYDLFNLGPPVDPAYPCCHPCKGLRYKNQRYREIIAAAKDCPGREPVPEPYGKPGIEILAVHNVACEVLPYPGPVGQSLRTDALEAILERRRGNEWWDMEQLDRYIRRGDAGMGNFRRHVSVLTFDDGWGSFREEALPLLEKYRVPACIFVTPWFLDGNLPYEVLLSISVPPGEYEDARSAMKGWSHEEREIEIDHMTCCRPEIEGELMLGWNDLEVLKEHPLVTIGAHGMHHVVISRQTEEDALVEVVGAKKALEDRLGIPIDYMSYPYGGYSRNVKRMARGSGYALAMAVRPDDGYWCRLPDAFQVPRVDVMALPEVRDGISSG